MDQHDQADVSDRTRDRSISLREYTLRVLIAVGIAALAFLLWQVVDVVVLVFGGILVAAVLRALADPVARHTPLSGSWALAVVVVGLIVVVGLAGWLLGQQIATQMDALAGTLGNAWSQVRAWLGESRAGSMLLDGLQSARGSLGTGLARAARIASTAAGGIAHAVLILFLGLFLAADPGVYRKGVIMLVPPRGHDAAGRALDASGHALKMWLLGQVVSMVSVGVLTGLGLWALGMPLALPLGLIAGLFEFVPYFGPIASAVPGILVAFTQSPSDALYVALLYFGVQQVESYVIMPLAQKWAVALPPALGLLSVVVFGLLFGLPGILFATPLMVVVMVLVKELYVKRALHEQP